MRLPDHRPSRWGSSCPAPASWSPATRCGPRCGPAGRSSTSRTGSTSPSTGSATRSATRRRRPGSSRRCRSAAIASSRPSAATYQSRFPARRRCHGKSRHLASGDGGSVRCVDLAGRGLGLLAALAGRRPYLAHPGGCRRAAAGLAGPSHAGDRLPGVGRLPGAVARWDAGRVLLDSAEWHRAASLRDARGIGRQAQARAAVGRPTSTPPGRRTGDRLRSSDTAATGLGCTWCRRWAERRDGGRYRAGRAVCLVSG